MNLIKTELAAAAHRPDTVEAYQASVARAVRHLREQLAEPLDLDRLAEIAAISKYHFVRVFDQVTGTTPQHFLSCLRMQRAKELLLNSKLPITEVCLEVGYSSLGSFSTTFRQLVGLGPQEFRDTPRKLDAMQFSKALFGFVAARYRVRGPRLVGEVTGPARPKGFIFVGTFNKGVPQGIPYSGTVLLTRGSFRIKRPVEPEFYLMAVLVPFTADLKTLVATLPVGLVASLRVRNADVDAGQQPCLRLRPITPTDPPIVLALPALPLKPY